MAVASPVCPWARLVAPRRRLAPRHRPDPGADATPAPAANCRRQLPDFFTDLKPENFGLIDGGGGAAYALRLASSNLVGEGEDEEGEEGRMATA